MHLISPSLISSSNRCRINPWPLLELGKSSATRSHYKATRVLTRGGVDAIDSNTTSLDQVFSLPPLIRCWALAMNVREAFVAGSRDQPRCSVSVLLPSVSFTSSISDWSGVWRWRRLWSRRLEFHSLTCVESLIPTELCPAQLIPLYINSLLPENIKSSRFCPFHPALQQLSTCMLDVLNTFILILNTDN